MVGPTDDDDLILQQALHTCSGSRSSSSSSSSSMHHKNHPADTSHLQRRRQEPQQQEHLGAVGERAPPTVKAVKGWRPCRCAASMPAWPCPHLPPRHAGRYAANSRTPPHRTPPLTHSSTHPPTAGGLPVELHQCLPPLLVQQSKRVDAKALHVPVVQGYAHVVQQEGELQEVREGGVRVYY